MNLNEIKLSEREKSVSVCLGVQMKWKDTNKQWVVNGEAGEK